MTLEVRCTSRSAVAPKLMRLLRSFAAELELGPCEVSLTLVRDASIRALKKQYFGIDAATDVLSFPVGHFPGPTSRPLGDIVISLDTARRAAGEFGNSLQGELALYLAHGLLHLLGYDHHTPKEAKAMARLERRLLGRAGMLARSDELR